MDLTIKISAVQGVTVAELAGELTAKTAPEAQQRILEQAQPSAKILLDLSRVQFMSSAGLRLLLVVYRGVTGKGGRAVLVGLTEDIKNTMAITGFLDFFAHRDTLEAGIAELTT